MLSYLETHTLEDLASLLKVPSRTLFIFLLKRGYKFSVFNTEKKNRERINKLDIYGDIIEDTKDFSDIQKQIIHGILFGDSGIYWSTEDRTAYLRCEHCWEQIGYCKAKIELFKPFSFNPFIDKPSNKKGFQDYQVGFSCHSSEKFSDLRKLFYIQIVSDKIHLQKDIMQVILWENLTPLSIAFWLYILRKMKRLRS